MKKSLNDKEKINLVNLYENGTTIKELSIKFDRAESSIRDLLKRRGIALRAGNIVRRKYKLNEDFFDEINNEAKAYFLGLLYADGCNKMNKSMVVLALQEKDKELVEMFNNLIHYDKPLYSEAGRGNRSNMFGIRICNKHICQQLEKLGCPPKKTFKLIFPNWLPENLVPHFIRGYFDGDGYVGTIISKKNQNNKRKSVRDKISITGTNEFLTEISSKLKKKLGVNFSIEVRYPQRKNNIISIVSSGRKQLEKIYHYLYSDSNYFLTRKRSKFLTIINRYI